MRQIFIFPGIGKWVTAVAGGLIGLGFVEFREWILSSSLSADPWHKLLRPLFLSMAVLDGIVLGFLVGWLASIMSRVFTSLAGRLVTGALVGVAGAVIGGLTTTLWAVTPNGRVLILLALGGLVVGSLSVILETRKTTEV
jgi:uncharacterized membrane protein YeaQ/YmgE (transglycosylase-associated protein family)